MNEVACQKMRTHLQVYTQKVICDVPGLPHEVLLSEILPLLVDDTRFYLWIDVRRPDHLVCFQKNADRFWLEQSPTFESMIGKIHPRFVDYYAQATYACYDIPLICKDMRPPWGSAAYRMTLPLCDGSGHWVWVHQCMTPLELDPAGRILSHLNTYEVIGTLPDEATIPSVAHVYAFDQFRNLPAVSRQIARRISGAYFERRFAPHLYALLETMYRQGTACRPATRRTLACHMQLSEETIKSYLKEIRQIIRSRHLTPFQHPHALAVFLGEGGFFPGAMSPAVAPPMSRLHHC